MSPTEPLEFRQLSQLSELPAEPDWLWQGYLARGTLTMLAGHPFAGKSMLVAGLIRALDESAEFLGLKTARAQALLVSEEDHSALRARAERLDLLRSRSTYVGRNTGVFDVSWRALIENATRYALDHDHALLVVDTFPGLARLEGEEENDAGAIAERLYPLQVAAGKGLSVLFLHHMNRYNQPRGSKAFNGVVDTSIRLLRNENSSIIRLEAKGRYPTTPVALKAKLIKAPDGWFYERLSGSGHFTGPTIATRTTDELLWQALLHAGNRGLSHRQLDEIDGLSRDIGKKRLPSLYTAGKVARKGAGTKSDPYRYSPAV